jgi:hypothetical protein
VEEVVTGGADGAELWEEGDGWGGAWGWVVLLGGVLWGRGVVSGVVLLGRRVVGWIVLGRVGVAGLREDEGGGVEE